MDIEVIAAGDRVVVRPFGELDMATADELEHAVEAGIDGRGQLIVDLRGLRFMDSVGLNVLLRSAAHAALRGVAFRVVRGRRTVDRVFDLTNTRSQFDFVDVGTEIDFQMLERSVG